MSKGFPITLIHLDSRRCVVVGGGTVAERKVESLRAVGARVTVIAPTLSDGLAELVARNAVDWVGREFRAGDLSHAFLVIAATDDAQVNRQVAREAEGCCLLINVVDDPAECNFIAPAVVRRGDLTIAVSTGGDAPALAAYLRAQLEEQFDGEWSAYVEWLTRIRDTIAARFPDHQARRQAWQRVLDSDLRTLIRTHTDDEITVRLVQVLDDQ